MIDPDLRIGVVGATGLVGQVTLRYLVDRGYTNIRTFASWRSAGGWLGDFEVEEATPAALSAGDLDVCFFSIGTQVSRELVPLAAGAGALCVDKSAAFRLEAGIPLVVPEVNGERALEHTGIVANPNCCTIPLTMALAPLHDAAGLKSVRVATYQSVSGAGSDAVAELRAEDTDDHQLRMDWEFDGLEYDEEVKLREETRKILELPDLPVSATCVRVPVVVGHAEAVWIETETPLAPADAQRILEAAPGLRLQKVPAHTHAIGIDEVLVGRVRADASVENGLALFLVSDNLRKGAALNAIQIAELLVGAELPVRQDGLTAARRSRSGRRLERLLHDTEHLLPLPFLHGLQAAEVQPSQLDASGRAKRPKAEVGKEVAREDGAVDEEALGRRRSLAIAIGERLERPGSLVACLADRGEEQRLLDPRLRLRQQIGTRDEHGVVRRRAGRKIGGTREERRRAVLHRPEDAAVIVAIDRPPRPPLVLGTIDPLALLRLAVAAGLPPDARLADRRRCFERGAGEPGEARGHCFAGGAPTRSTTTSTDATSRFAMRPR